jgi:polyhydroxybutyrate depolymerase
MKTGNQSGSVRVNGKKRTFRIYIPKDCSASQHPPLVIVLHGAIGSGRTAAWDSRMSAQSGKDHFVVAYPNGILRTWNAGGCCGPARRWHVDDVGFIHTLIQKCKSDLQIDGDRVFVTGISNGGMMAYRLGGELADEIAAVAPIDGCMYPFETQSDAPVSVVSVHGTADRIIRYNGGTGSMFGYKVTSKSVADTMQYWVKRDRCTTVPTHNVTGHIAKDLYSGGKDGTEVCLYTINEGGHVWPGGRRCTMFGDRPTKEFSATQAICDFFLSHPKHKTADNPS